MSCMEMMSASMPVISEMREHLAGAVRQARDLHHSVNGRSRSGGERRAPGIFRLAIETMFSIRASASRCELACTVVSEPSWPVFMACNMSKASSPRTSPTTMRSGRIRRLLMTSCRWRTAPLPSMLGGRVSRRTTCSCFICNSAASSMVTMRSLFGMYPERTLSTVVLPAPVPPEIRRLRRPFTMAESNSSMGSVRRLVFDHLAGRDRIASETADGEAGSVDGQRRNDGVDAGAVGQAGIHHGRGFVDAAADARDDAVDDLHQVAVVFEGEAGRFQFAAALDVDLVEAVDEDVGDARIFEQRLERAKAEDFVENLAGQAFAFGKAEGHGFAVDRVADQDQNFLARGLAVGAAEFLQIEAVEDLAMEVGLYLLVFGPLELLQICHGIPKPF